MVCAGVRITCTGEEWAPSSEVSCSPAGTHGLHGKPIRWLRAETVSGGSSAWRVNVVIDRGRRCRHRGLFPFFLHLDTLAKSVTPQGMSSSAQHPRPILLGGRTCLLRHTWMHTHARSCVHACPCAHAHTRGIWTPLVACVPLGGGFLGAPSVLIYPQPPSRLPGQRTEVLDSDPAYLVAEMFIEMELVGN